jgi:prefoldin subunit 5
MELETRVQTLESHIEAMERELGEVYGAVEHLVRSNESIQKTLQQQRYGRYVMWSTLIAILAIVWLTLRSRLGMLGTG